MEYFYTPPSRIQGNQLTIEEEEFAHLTHVMRKGVGDVLCVVDGEGNAYEATIDELRYHSALCTIRSHTARLHEPKIELLLGVGILKNPAKFDFLVEKTTELGVCEIVPLVTERTIPRHAKTERWQKIAMAAMKQSGRCVLPRIRELTTLNEFLLSSPSDAPRFMPHELSDKSIAACLPLTDCRKIVACIGPEGGFTEDETRLAEQTGFELVSLGVRRLRAETAAMITTALLVGFSPIE
jgi:16S rRNA (uracil1498-N3)-methyltransferase